MDLILGLVALFAVMFVAIYARGLILQSMRKNSKVIYKDLKVYSSAGSNPGIMVYVTSIVTVIIGPVSYRLYPLNDLQYVIMNCAAALLFALTYPPFSPVTGFATIDVIETRGIRYCIVGKVMNRKFKLISIKEEPSFEIVAETRRHRLIFEVRNEHSSRT